MPTVQEVWEDGRPEQNKQVVREWNDLAIRQPEAEEAVIKDPEWTHRHQNLGSADGPATFVKPVNWSTHTDPDFRTEPKRIIAEHSCVVLHSHLIRDPGESWTSSVSNAARSSTIGDDVQEGPETPANDNTMFSEPALGANVRHPASGAGQPR